jgi:hypothetical protein
MDFDCFIKYFLLCTQHAHTASHKNSALRVSFLFLCYPPPGLAIETEFQILNTLLAEKAAQLALTENRLFRIFCRWDGVERDDVLEVVEGVDGCFFG